MTTNTTPIKTTKSFGSEAKSAKFAISDCLRIPGFNASPSWKVGALQPDIHSDQLPRQELRLRFDDYLNKMADSEAITHQASPPGSEIEPGTPALDVGSKLPDTKEDDDDDSGSVHTTTTDDIFAKDLPTIRQPQKIGQRELGLHCTLGLGWYGSAYDDYEYEDDGSIWL